MVDTLNNWFLEMVAAAAAIGLMWQDLLVSLAILVGAAVIAVLFSKILFRLMLRAARLFPGDLDDHLVSTAKGPVTAYILLLGAYLAIKIPLELPHTMGDVVDRGASVAAIVIGTYMINVVGSSGLAWLQDYLGSTAAANTSSWALPLARRSLLIVVAVMAVMVSLDVLGINITPLIAGLGIGGVAVALAIQPTLSNLFAGTYVITEGVVNPGDYIEMDGGVSGYVVDVNWRSTRLRTWTNNLVIIPNSRFADSVITNYSKPDEHVNVYLTCGVAYESDLGRVEQVGHEVMERVLAEHPGAVLDYGAYFGYETFGESNIDFWLFVQAKDRLASFEVRSELIKQLHSRLAEEGITINYPVRTLHFPDGWNPQDGAPLLPGAAAVRTPAILRTRADLAADTPGGGDGPDV
jgi:small-conductance mechanosensitive channel